jgi:cob(I)alamin adenosyltransferase
MSIATGTGDRGDSGLIGGARVPKDDIRLEAYGTVDELNAAISAAIAHGLPAESATQLERISHWLFDLGADLATPGSDTGSGSPGKPALRLGDERARTLTEWIHALEAVLPPLRAFILPGGSPAAAALHVARTVCRRAERRVVTLLRATGDGRTGLVFLNRLGDLLFLHARAANRAAGQDDVEWRSG